MKEQRQDVGSQVGVIERHYPPISAIIPARNEARNLQHVLPLMPSIVTEVVLVDRHSSNSTVTVDRVRPLAPSMPILCNTSLSNAGSRTDTEQWGF